MTNLRLQWEQIIGCESAQSDGFVILDDMKVKSKRASYPEGFAQSYRSTITSICSAIEMPIRYAGNGEWSIFQKPEILSKLLPTTTLPNSNPNDKCLIISGKLWETFEDMSLWVEALCVQQWALFCEAVSKSDIDSGIVSRGVAFEMLTDKKNSRKPLTWERNNINIPILEGQRFICPWTETAITTTAYDLDHLIPVSAYPINELWNLVPSDSYFNLHGKRDRLPSLAKMIQATPILGDTYKKYLNSNVMSPILHEDVALRFTTVDFSKSDLENEIARVASNFVLKIAEARNLPRFG